MDTPVPRSVDLLVVGGGINGAGIARDAAGRGLRVLLVEQEDLGSHTSSSSSKLIHGGLRYLEQYKFRLVAEALAEREVMLRAAPHLVRPMRFVMPHVPQLRPAWMIRAGLFLYDYLARRATLPGSHAVNLGPSPYGAGFKRGIRPRLRLLRLPGGRFAARGRDGAGGGAGGRGRAHPDALRERAARQRRLAGQARARGRNDARGDARRRSRTSPAPGCGRS